MIFNGNLHEIIEIVEEILGNPRREAVVDGWTEYNCPNCTSENGNIADNKYNFCINYSKGIGHCWKCGTSGKLSKYIKIYGGRDKLTEYSNIIKEIRRQQQYSLNSTGITDDIEILKVENTLSLPKDYINLYNNDSKYAKEALDYLKNRNLDKNFIKKYNIGYVGYWSNDFSMRNRIIIPSYDEFGDINYYIARDYTGTNTKRKYNNPKIPKTSYIFNERFVNWYEDITLVEGVFDHMVIPNSIPLLGKHMDKNSAIYAALTQRSMANINILLDDDAIKDAKKLYFMLDDTILKGRIRIIDCEKGYDASLIYQRQGIDGIKHLMRKKRKLDDFDKLFMA